MRLTISTAIALGVLAFAPISVSNAVAAPAPKGAELSQSAVELVHKRHHHRSRHHHRKRLHIHLGGGHKHRKRRHHRH